MNDDMVPAAEMIALLQENIRLLEQLVEMKAKTISLLENAVRSQDFTIENLRREIDGWVSPEQHVERRLWLIDHFMGGL